MFRFTEDCIIGIPEIDAEHKYLFELINQGMKLAESTPDGNWNEVVQSLLEELNGYAKQHFAHEEEYMEQIRDPELLIQRRQHTMFRNKLQDWFFEYMNDMKDQRQLLREILEYLARWLYRHIIASDSMIGKLPPIEEWLLRVNPCEFSDIYRTGIAFIDEEHSELFRITDRAYQRLRYFSNGDAFDDIAGILLELKSYTKYHFEKEEAYMERIQYEGLEVQRRAHESFVDRISDTNLIAEENLKEYLERLVEFLLGWLVNHILYLDKKIPKV